MSRILAQPIYRDALLFGKFLAGARDASSISLVTLWLLVIGFGLFRLGMPPSGEEIGRLLMFLLVTIAYAGVWLALAMLFSVIVPLDRDRGAGGARPLAVPGAAVAGAGADARRGDLAVRHPLRPARPADARHAGLAAGRCRASRPARSTARPWWRCSIRTRSR